tara:strand:- start:68 stop:220 length:153 start_codon:yes stop_codon:yes gene_type:complete
MSRNTWIEIIVFVVAGFGSDYLFDIGLWSFLVGVLAAALYRTVVQGKNDE